MDHEQTRASTEILAVNLLDPKSLIGSFGLVGVYTVIFVETGLFFGFFLPGDSLLFIAGIASSSVAEQLVGAKLSFPALMVGVPIMAIAGAQLGHFLGAKFGRSLFDRPESRIFKAQYVEKAEHYFNKFGPAKAVVLARFIPVVRAFLNPVAGILEMPAKKFLLWNVIGGVVWTDSILLLGNRTAGVIPPSVIDRYVLPVIAAIVVISVLPMLIELVRGIRGRRRAAAETESTDAPEEPATRR
ncbi:DedA family protein [Actinocatenispora rupis]|uniref:Membrane protein n=1 Tax=Actinocatenispora rupis TaxID=519421 RepID=A0A8J3J8U2_9ACTN|nr:DedA family protein [Actinocatenispora rupis]GID14005.1 membrane protein [Actinocatenispora rupis]